MPQSQEGFLDPGSALGTFAARMLGSEPESVQEIGNGNLNHVFRLAAGDRSIVIKQALPYVRRIGESWPLTIGRLGIEARAYDVHSRVCPGLLPEVLGYDDELHLLALEDLREAADWRTLLTRGLDARIDETAALAGTYCGLIAVETGPLQLTTQQATELRAAFSDPAMQIFTERMVFAAPFRTDVTNDWPDHLLTVANRIRDDAAVHAAARRARWLFRTSGEALLHGDLHSGSIMAGTAQDARIIDLEFAFVGPIAFDLGNLVAHLLLARARRMVADGDFEAIDGAARTFWSTFTDTLRTTSLSTGYWNTRFERKLLSECALFAGVELLRRVGGRFHVDDISSLDPRTRESAERLCINFWYRLTFAPELREFDELWDVAITSTKEYP